MSDTETHRKTAEARLRRPLFLTRAGLWAERITRAFWPLWSVLFAGLAALMLGAHEVLPLEAVWILLCLLALGVLVTFTLGVRRFRTPTRAEALDRLDRTLPGRPITALADTQAIGSTDDASVRVWRAHVARMADRVGGAKPVAPDLRVADRDPFALRYVAVLAFAVAVLFGSLLKVTTVEAALPGGNSLSTGPTWEAWAEPPTYTGKPSIYLNDLRDSKLRIPKGSRLTIRLYGEVGQLTVAETVSARIGDVTSAADTVQSFDIVQHGHLAIEGPGGRAWQITVESDFNPTVQITGIPERGAAGEMKQRFIARDDYGVEQGIGWIGLDKASVDRRHGKVVDPEEREPLVFDLPMPFTGDRTDFEEIIAEDFSQHAWAGLPVEMVLTVEDALGQTGQSVRLKMTLEGRRFFDPMASAIIEQRGDLLWNLENAPRVSGMIRAISHRPDGFIENNTAYLKLRVTLRRLETLTRFNQFTAEKRDEIADALWAVALSFEDGRLSNALERLRQAQDRLNEAMRKGANDEEIAQLMQELREAMQEYMRQLAQENQQGDQSPQQAQNQQSQEITGDQLNEMLERLQELMEQGRMAEAQELLDQMRQMMENMQVTEGQQGQGGQSPGEQAMEGLQETLREQQGLSDEAFRDLQEQFNPGAQAGQSGQNRGRNGGQGEGAEHEGQGQGQGQAEGGGNSEGQPGQSGETAGSLADRQQALREELNRQERNMPGAGTPEGDAAREALGRAGDAMDGAEEALRNNDLAEALDNQAEAMQALREGMQNLGEAMAQSSQNANQFGEQGAQRGEDNKEARDPLGRQAGNQGRIGSEDNLLQGDDVYRRAEELLDEIRRRSGEQGRPEQERSYLKRLLDRF